MALSVFTSGLRPNFRSCATLNRGHVPCRSVAGYLGSRILSAKRWQSTVPYKSLIGAVTDTEYREVSQRIDAVVKRYLEKTSFAEKMKSSARFEEQFLPSSLSAATPTATYLSWEGAPMTSTFKMKEGLPYILNSDKEVLIKLLACLAQKGKIGIQKKVIVANEGCDIGDFLALVVPMLKELGAETQSILLTNGKREKLEHAAKMGMNLLSKQDVFTFLENAFDGLPGFLKTRRDMQTLFLFFRLMIVERPEKIASFLKTRLENMHSQDIGVGSFLLNDEVSRRTVMTHYKLNPSRDSTTAESLLFKRVLSKPVQSVLRKRGVAETDLDVCMTAFSPQKVRAMLEENGGEVIHMAQIPTVTDEELPVNVIGTIFKKKS